jgi:nicotinate-nucleotide pyrophosphorylase (carboxylating)
MALEEDSGRGDVTTRLTVPADARGVGRVFARESLTMSGADVFETVMRQVDPGISVKIEIRDGSTAQPEEALIVATGCIASLLTAERVALNFLQHLAGVATLTRAFVARLPMGASVRITDTRKTTPGMRFLERRAVLHGGGYNHRVDLAGGVLIKENHVAAAGTIAKAVQRCKKGAPHPLRIQVEVQSLSELRQALDAGADAVLLDNMDIPKIEQCVAEAKGRAFVEASGGIDLDTVAAVSATGVDAISVGALTHSVTAADMTFLLDHDA